MTVEERVLGLVARLAPAAKRKRVALDDSLVDDLAFDSLAFVDLTVAIEREFALSEFPMRAWLDSFLTQEHGSDVATVEELADAVRERMEENDAEAP